MGQWCPNGGLFFHDQEIGVENGGFGETYDRGERDCAKIGVTDAELSSFAKRKEKDQKAVRMVTGVREVGLNWFLGKGKEREKQVL